MLRLTGTGFVTTPDTAGLSITGDIDLRALIQSDDIIPSSDQGIIAKWAAGQQSYAFFLNSAGGLGFDYSTDGSATVSADSTATVASAALFAGDAYHARVTHRVNNGAGSRDTKFYTSLDGSTWTQLGDTITAGARPQAARDSATLIYVVECRNQDDELLISGTAEVPRNG